MRTTLSISLFVVTLLPLLQGCGGDDADCVCPASLTLNVGHRGSGNSSATNPLPENTLPSIEAAMADGADGVEIDVQLSADGTLVLMHDFEVDHTTDGTGCVNALTLEELQALDAGNPASLGTGIGVPTLAEVLDTFDEGVLDVELKVSQGHLTCGDTDRAATVAALLSDLEGFPRNRIVVSSFDLEVLKVLRAQDPTVTIALLGAGLDTIATAEAEGFEAAAVLVLAVNASTVADAHGRGLALWVWTLDDEAVAETLIDAGVDGVITNDVVTVRSVKERLCADFTC
jgi:glycerophosphoryl diester phosphodiesterase